MKQVAKKMNKFFNALFAVLFCGVVFTGCADRSEKSDDGVYTSVSDGAIVLRSGLGSTNLVAGETVDFIVELIAPPEFKAQFQNVSFDGFLVFAEEHPAYEICDDGSLIYRHIYHLQARAPGVVKTPIVKARVTDILNETDPKDLSVPAMDVEILGVNVKENGEVKWSDMLEVVK